MWATQLFIHEAANDIEYSLGQVQEFLDSKYQPADYEGWEVIKYNLNGLWGPAFAGGVHPDAQFVVEVEYDDGYHVLGAVVACVIEEAGQSRTDVWRTGYDDPHEALRSAAAGWLQYDVIQRVNQQALQAMDDGEQVNYWIGPGFVLIGPGHTEIYYSFATDGGGLLRKRRSRFGPGTWEVSGAAGYHELLESTLGEISKKDVKFTEMEGADESAWETEAGIDMAVVEEENRRALKAIKDQQQIDYWICPGYVLVGPAHPRHLYDAAIGGGNIRKKTSRLRPVLEVNGAGTSEQLVTTTLEAISDRSIRFI